MNCNTCWWHDHAENRCRNESLGLLSREMLTALHFKDTPIIISVAHPISDWLLKHCAGAGALGYRDEGPIKADYEKWQALKAKTKEVLISLTKRDAMVREGIDDLSIQSRKNLYSVMSWRMHALKQNYGRNYKEIRTLRKDARALSKSIRTRY